MVDFIPKTMRKLLFAICCLMCTTGLMAQNTDYQKAIARYKTVKTATASVTKIQHRRAVKDDKVTTGGLFILKPDMVSISTDEGRDRLVMKGSRFTMTVSGRDHTTDSRQNPQFATFQCFRTSSMEDRTSVSCQR